MVQYMRKLKRLETTRSCDHVMLLSLSAHNQKLESLICNGINLSTEFALVLARDDIFPHFKELKFYNVNDPNESVQEIISSIPRNPFHVKLQEELLKRPEYAAVNVDVGEQEHE